MLYFVKLQRLLKNILGKSTRLIQPRNLTIYAHKLSNIVLDDALLRLQRASRSLSTPFRHALMEVLANSLPESIVLFTVAVDWVLRDVQVALTKLTFFLSTKVLPLPYMNIVNGCHLNTTKVGQLLMEGSAKMMLLPARKAYLLCPAMLHAVQSVCWVVHWNL